MEQILFSIEDVAKIMGEKNEVKLFNFSKKMGIQSLLNREENNFWGSKNKIIFPQILKEKCLTEEDIDRLVIGLKIENNVTIKLEGDIERLKNKITNQKDILETINNKITQYKEELQYEKNIKEEKINKLNKEINDKEKRLEQVKDQIKELNLLNVSEKKYIDIFFFILFCLITNNLKIEGDKIVFKNQKLAFEGYNIKSLNDAIDNNKELKNNVKDSLIEYIDENFKFELKNKIERKQIINFIDNNVSQKIYNLFLPIIGDYLKIKGKRGPKKAKNKKDNDA